MAGLISWLRCTAADPLGINPEEPAYKRTILLSLLGQEDPICAVDGFFRSGSSQHVSDGGKPPVKESGTVPWSPGVGGESTRSVGGLVIALKQVS